ncbi:MAG: response regulator [Fibrobacterota bacterium]
MEFKILIVDIVPAQLRALENILVQAGCGKIFQAKNVKEAVGILEKEPDIRLVISEWDLPDKPGLEILSALKKNGRLEKTQFLLTFKDKSREDILKALKAGAKGFVVKPYKLDIIKKKIDEISLSEAPPASYDESMANILNSIKQVE